MNKLASLLQANSVQTTKAIDDLKDSLKTVHTPTNARGTVQNSIYIPNNHVNTPVNSAQPRVVPMTSVDNDDDDLNTPKVQMVMPNYKLGYDCAAMDPAIQIKRDNTYFTESEVREQLERPPYMNRREMFHTKDRAVPKFKIDKDPIEWFDDFMKYGKETGRGLAEMLYTTLSLCFEGDEKVWFKVNKAKWKTIEAFRVDLLSTFANAIEIHKKRIKALELLQTMDEDPIIFASKKWECFKLYHPEMAKDMRIMTIIKLLNPRYSSLMGSFTSLSVNRWFQQRGDCFKP